METVKLFFIAFVSECLAVFNKKEKSYIREPDTH